MYKLEMSKLGTKTKHATNDHNNNIHKKNPK